MRSYEIETCVNADDVDDLKKEIDEFCIEYEDIVPYFDLKTLRNIRKLMTVGTHISDNDMKISRNIRKRFRVGVYILMQCYQDLGEKKKFHVRFVRTIHIVSVQRSMACIIIHIIWP